MHKKMLVLVIYLIVIVLLGQLPTISSTQGITLIPIDDAEISLNKPDLNRGAREPYLGVWNEYCDSAQGFCVGSKSYLKFDLSDIPSSALIDSAELTLFLYTEASETGSVGVHYCANNSWDEFSITWNNAPSFESSPLDICYGIASEIWYSWNVTNAVERALATGTLTLVLNEANTPSFCNFRSKDRYVPEDTRPKLIINFSGVETNEPPVAEFSYSPLNPTINETIQFTDLTIDSDGTIVSWNWDFGDNHESFLQDPQHKYNSSGTYSVSLIVTDNDGAPDSFSKTITIKDESTENNTNGSAATDETGRIPGFEVFIIICSILVIILYLKINRNR